MLCGAWRTQVEALSACAEIMSLYRRLAAMHERYRQTTDDNRQTGMWQYRLIGLPAMSRQKAAVSVSLGQTIDSAHTLQHLLVV